MKRYIQVHFSAVLIAFFGVELEILFVLLSVSTSNKYTYIHRVTPTIMVSYKEFHFVFLFQIILERNYIENHRLAFNFFTSKICAVYDVSISFSFHLGSS